MAFGAEVRLTGRVTDETGAPVAGAKVFLTVPERLEAATDATGVFHLAAPAPGAFPIAAEREGFFRLKERLIELQDGNNEIALELNRARAVFESVDVPAVLNTVDATQVASQETLTGKQILFVPFPSTNSLRNALRIVPGVVQDSRGGIHINGGSEDQTLYTLDGFNVSDPLTGRFESRLSVESVQEVELYSGRFSAEYGKGSAGTLAVKTTSGDDKLRYSGTNFVPGIENRKGLMIGNWTPRVNLSGPIVKGRAWFSNSLDARYDQTRLEDIQEGPDTMKSWRYSNLLRNQINLTPSNILYTGFLVNYWNAPRTGLSVLDPIETTVDRRSRQWFVHVKDQMYFTRGALFEIGYAANRTFGREIPQGHNLYVFRPEGKGGTYFMDATRKASRDQLLGNFFLPSFSWRGGHRLKMGVDLNRVSYWQDARRTGIDYYGNGRTALRRVLFAGSGRLSESNWESGAYIQDAWRAKSNLTIEAGLRHDWDRILGNHRASPRIGFAWSPWGLEHTRISGGYAIVFDATSLRLFTRPLDQYSLTTYFQRDGSIGRGPAVSLYSIDRSTDLRSSRYGNWSLGLAQALPWNLYVRVDWLRKRGYDGFTYANSITADRPAPPDLLEAFGATTFDAIYRLGNDRRDRFDSLHVQLRKTFGTQYEVMGGYTRSRAFSNAVVDVNVDDPIIITENVGPMPWDTPNRLVSWGVLPTFWKNWSTSYLMDWRTGFPFSIQDDEGRLQGKVNSLRFPTYFELNIHAERRFVFRGYRWAFRMGLNNITNRRNPTLVNNNTAAAQFLTFYGGQGRTTNFRIRWLGRK
ncbi:MAG: carboxypeptidase regulatory-like domain-containing protein [Bryobacteraceae bacterium]